MRAYRYRVLDDDVAEGVPCYQRGAGPRFSPNIFTRVPISHGHKLSPYEHYRP